MAPDRPPSLLSRGLVAALSLLAIAVMLVLAVQLLERIWLPLLVIVAGAVSTAACVSWRRGTRW
jgi:hypothetical protein